MTGVHTANSDIRAVEFTPSRDGDSSVLPELLGQIPEDEDVGTVTADGACDKRRCHGAIIARGATAFIPIRKNGRAWKEDCPAAKARNETLRATRQHGRAFWKQWTGYHARSRAEAGMRCLTPFGERIAATDPDRQTAEIRIRVALMNRFNAPRYRRDHARGLNLKWKGDVTRQAEVLHQSPMAASRT